MAQEQIQEQRLTQQQKLAQTITQQQLLQAQLIELPITQLMERVTTEMDDNPALEVSTDKSYLYIKVACLVRKNATIWSMDSHYLSMTS